MRKNSIGGGLSLLKGGVSEREGAHESEETQEGHDRLYWNTLVGEKRGETWLLVYSKGVGAK